MYSTHNEGKYVVAERFIRTLKSKTYKHMATVSKNLYFDVLDYFVSECNNTYHKTVKMKPIDFKPGFYAEYNTGSKEKILNLILVKMQEYKNAKTIWY